jgi:hypothetical protein
MENMRAKGTTIRSYVCKDERFNLFISFQKTKGKNWNQYYISFLFWTFNVLIVKNR